MPFWHGVPELQGRVLQQDGGCACKQQLAAILISQLLNLSPSLKLPAGVWADRLRVSGACKGVYTPLSVHCMGWGGHNPNRTKQSAPCLLLWPL